MAASERELAIVKKETIFIEESLARLRKIIAAFDGQAFAVIDGAHFEDITVILKRRRLFARSVYLDSTEAEIRKAGPWLIKLDQAKEATDQVVDLVCDKPAAVFWSCAAGEVALWRHLRSLNVVRLPRWAAEGGSVPPAERLKPEDDL